MRTLARLAAAVAALTAVAAAPPAAAAAPEVYTPRFSSLALGGYDAVAYFKQGQPIRGAAEFSYEYKGATWRFATTENRAAFIADPDAYAPQYGGYCAWAAARGYTAPGNPKNWKVVDGRLYLNYNDSVQREWEKDIPGFIASADKNWPDILK